LSIQLGGSGTKFVAFLPEGNVVRWPVLAHQSDWDVAGDILSI
jgi:hypothetical protein